MPGFFLKKIATADIIALNFSTIYLCLQISEGFNRRFVSTKPKQDNFHVSYSHYLLNKLPFLAVSLNRG